MNTHWRKQKAKRLLESLEALENEWLFDAQVTQSGNHPCHMSRRERFKAVEAQTAIIRLIQGESRLKQQVLLGVASFATGSFFTWLVQRLIGS